MTDTITLPRAVGEQMRDVLRGVVNASDDDCGDPKCDDCNAVRPVRETLAVIDAALKEPEPITEDALREGIDAQDRDLWQRRADEEVLKEYGKRESITVAKMEHQLRITCGFVDVQFDGKGWFCAKCSERMPANYEAMVKHYSGERDYLKLMQRKAERFHGIGEEDK